MKIQRTWIAHRDASCPTAERNCLLAAYRQHHEWLDVLSNRLSEDAPLADLDAYSLRGRWMVDTVADPDGKGEALPNDLALTMMFMHLPKAGAILLGSYAQTCFNNGCLGFGWDKNLLKDFDYLYKKGWSEKLGPDTPAFVALLNGKALFTLVQVSHTRLQANITLCDAHENCRRGYQAWRTASPDAKLVALAP